MHLMSMVFRFEYLAKHFLRSRVSSKTGSVTARFQQNWKITKLHACAGPKMVHVEHDFFYLGWSLRQFVEPLIVQCLILSGGVI